MKNNEVLEELFAAEEAAMGSLHPATETVIDLSDRLEDFRSLTNRQTEELAGTLTQLREDLKKRIVIAQDLYRDLEPAQQLSDAGKQLQERTDALEALLRGITHISDAFDDLKLLF